MGRNIPFLTVMLFLFSSSSMLSSGESCATDFSYPLELCAFQTHQPTKQGNVPHIQSEEAAPSPQAKARTDPDQLQREGLELLELSQTLQADIDSVNRGLHPKDVVDKLKRIQKLAKHMRGEIEP
jgi:hypothetical protein